MNLRELPDGDELQDLFTTQSTILTLGPARPHLLLLSRIEKAIKRVYELADQSVRDQWSDASRRGALAELITRWKTRLLRKERHLAPPVEEASPFRPAAAVGSDSDDDSPPAVPPVPIGPVIQLANSLVLVHKPYLPAAVTTRTRVTLTVTDPGGFDGSGTFAVTSPSARLNFFDAAVAGNLVTTAGRDFAADELNAGVVLFAEGEIPSNAMDDIVLRLSLSGGSRPILPPVTAHMTSIEVTLDIHESRTASGSEPAVLSTSAKINSGRFVHVQNASFHHGRALVIVRKAVPATFPGNLELRSFDGHVRLFADPDEIAAVGQAPVALPLVIANGGIGATGQRFWAEGSGVSGALADTGFKLGVAGLGPDGDHVRMTAVQFHNLSARIRSTPPHIARMGNAAAPHVFALGGTHTRDFDESFAVREPLVLVRDSLDAAHPIELSVAVNPAGAPVMWSIERAVNPGTADPIDHADVLALTGSALPTLDPTGSVTLNATLLPDSVGSFHVRAFIDCNGTNDFERHDAAGARIDREPYILMNLVLVHVTLSSDNSQTHPANFVGVAAGGGINVTGGTFNIGAPLAASIHMNAIVEIVGGGADGKLGLTRIFGGWINNEANTEDIVGTFLDSTVAPPVVHTHASVFASNLAAATGAHPSGSAAFRPVDPAPTLVVAPVLDTGRLTPGTGGDTATLSRSRIRVKRDLAPQPGQRWLIESVDSPGDGDPANHIGFPAAVLTRFRFNLRFRAALCFWTNFGGSSGATGNSAERLYCVVRRYRWTMRGEWTINPVTGAVAPAGVPAVTISEAQTDSPAVPVAGSNLEVRAPTGLSLLARDCRA